MCPNIATRIVQTSLLLVLIASASADPAVHIVRDKGKSATANFETIDSSGCVITDVFIFGSIGRHRQSPDPRIDTLVAGVSINQFDRCSNVLLMSAVGATNTINFSFRNNMAGATLSASIPVDDVVAGTSFTVTADVTWTGVGDITRERTRSRTHEPGITVITVFNGKTREASASGTISDGATNFIPAGSLVNAELQESNSGEITITHD